MGGDEREDILMMHNNCAMSRKLGKCIFSSNRKLSSENIEHCQNLLNQVFNQAVRMNLFILIQDFATF